MHDPYPTPDQILTQASPLEAQTIPRIVPSNHIVAIPATVGLK